MKLLQWEENRGRYITEKLQFHCVATESPPRDGSGGLTQVSMFKRWWLASLYSTVSWSVVIWPEHSVEAVCMEPSQTWVGVCFHDPMDSEVRRRKKARYVSKSPMSTDFRQKPHFKFFFRSKSCCSQRSWKLTQSSAFSPEADYTKIRPSSSPGVPTSSLAAGYPQLALANSSRWIFKAR